ncbi:MAG: GNAT family N-acetyltransferase [Frankiales bacterium]|nr:GNAT family N-acetyltransferase [Frankiales bacterium]
MPEVVLRRAVPDDLPVVERLWQLDRHEMAEFWRSRPDPDGLFRPGVPAMLVSDPDRDAWFILADGRVAGLASTRRRADGARSVFSFLVVRAARRSGVGRAAAAQVLAAHPGEWAVAFQEVNAGAAVFWRSVAAGAAVDGVVREEVETTPRGSEQVWLRFATT